MTSFSSFLADLEDDRATIVSDQAVTHDRRSKIRYPLDLAIRFSSASGPSPIPRLGRTLNMSSNGVLVFSQDIDPHEFGVGAELQMSIDWPFLLDDRIPLQLVVVGRMIRRGASIFAATFIQQQLRTSKARA